MIYTIIGIMCGIIVAFSCMMFYRRGLKDGMQVTGRVETIIKKPEFLKTPVEKELEKEEKEKLEQEQEIEKELTALFSYQPKHTAKRGEDT